MMMLLKDVPPEVWLWISFGLCGIVGLSLFFVDLFTSRLSPAEEWWLAITKAKENQQRSCVSSETHKAYRIIDDGEAIEFYPCRTISYNLNDIHHRYCGVCNRVISREL